MLRDYLQGLFAGTGFTSQVYELSPFFLHKEWIMEQWEKSYYMSSIAGANNGSSLVVMSKDTFGFLPLVAVKFLTKVQRVVQNSGPSIVGTLTVFVDHSGFVCVLMETSDDEKKVAIVVANGKSTRKDRAVKKKSSAGTKFVDEVLNGDNERCVESFRMDKSVFYKLCDILQTKGLLRHTSRIKIEEQLAIFMFIIGHNLRTRAVQELFKYSGETISRHFNNVLNAIIAISLDFFKPPGSEIPPEIRDDPRFYPYFTDCVGAVTGVHFPVIVGVDEQGPFRNKNGALSQSVIAACSFDMKFHYVLAGWEGSAPDLKVLNSALTRKNKLEVPEGKYFLVDFKYANIPGFIAPYLGSQYGLLEHENRFHPQDAQELFNHRHSLLRGITDKTFGALKERFPILMSAPSYPLPTQVKLVVAACALHNYIREEKPDDNIFKMYEHEGCVSQMDESLIQPLDVQKPEMMMNEDSQMMELDVPFDAQQIENSSQLRDSIATEIWNDYIHDFPVTEG